MRDDFAEKIKETLAKRVGTHCSNPRCWKLTSGPRDEPTKAVNIGVASHITAAAVGGPRYDPSLTTRQRSCITNAIWLCQNCAKLIDNDTTRYTVDLLRQWKTLAEETARLGVETTGAAFALQPISDAEQVKAYAQCFDRPAFQDHFRQEGSMEAFDKAIEDTIIGINTGSIRSRDGQVLLQTRGKVFLKDRQIRERMDVIVDLLRWIRFRYTDAVKRKAITFHGVSGGTTSYCINEGELSHWMDDTRLQVLQLFSEVCHQVGIHPPSLRPGQRHAFPTIPIPVPPKATTMPEDMLGKQPPLGDSRERLLALVHELHSPLGAIRGAAEYIQSTKDPAEIDACAKDISSWCSLITRLVHTLALVDRDAQEFRFQESLLLRDIVSPAINSLGPMLKEKGFDRTQIHLSDMSSIPPLWLDRLSFQQVIFNLLANAVKYSRPATPFRVVAGAVSAGSFYRISICDWGVGIPDNQRELLFKAGFRGVNARSMDIRGAGLGLAVAKSIVEAHGGTTCFRSFGSPTEIEINLPVTLARNPPNHSRP